MSHTTHTPPAPRRDSILTHPVVTAGIAAGLFGLAILGYLNVRESLDAAPAQPEVSVQADCDPASGPFIQITWSGFPAPADGHVPVDTGKGDELRNDPAHYARFGIQDSQGATAFDMAANPAATDGIWETAPGPVTVTVTWPGVAPVVKSVTAPNCERT